MSEERERILAEIRAAAERAERERQAEQERLERAATTAPRSQRYARKARRVGKGVVFRARRGVDRLPPSARAALIRRRHLMHVTTNMGQLTDPAYLGRPPADIVGWIDATGMPAGPSAGYSLDPLDPAAAAAARAWLAAGPYDSDALLERRTDNHGDELGRTMAALRLRLRLADRPAVSADVAGSSVLFDARCLQSAAFGTRGIGRFAKAALVGARAALGDDRLVLLVDRGLEELPMDLAGDCRQVTRVEERDAARYTALVQPSPMTATADPLVPLLHGKAHCIAVVFDFIPMHYPTIYLRHYAARAEYAAALDSLRLYDEFVCISDLARVELLGFLGAPAEGPGSVPAVVAWPRDVLPPGEVAAAGDGTGPIVVMTGDEPRKNTFGALAAIGAATAGGAEERDVVVIGMAGQETRVHHWSIGAAMRPGEARTLGRISDAEMEDLLANASLVVVASFDEGLSLPVIEAVRAGAPVVAADIPAHRELIGTGSFLADPASPASMSAAIRRHRHSAATREQQLRSLLGHRHGVLEDVIGSLVSALPIHGPTALPAGRHRRDGPSASDRLRDPLGPSAHRRRGLLHDHDDRTGPTGRRHGLHHRGCGRRRVDAGRRADRRREHRRRHRAGLVRRRVRVSGGQQSLPPAVPRGARSHRRRRRLARHPPGRDVHGPARRGRGAAGDAARHREARPRPVAGRADRRHAPAPERRVLGGGTSLAHAHHAHAERGPADRGRDRNRAAAAALREPACSASVP